jgi:Protein of unknown function (DUF3224)
MVYPGDGSAKLVGLERVVGRLGDRWGSFVLEHSGTFEGGVAEASWSVVPGREPGNFAACEARAASPLRTPSATPSPSTTTSSKRENR